MNTEHRPSILVVDDAKSNIDFMIALLDPHFDVAVALSGEEALEWLEQDLPDLILLDIVMPGMDGYEVCRHLKSKARTADIPVIFTTGMSDEEHIEAAFEAGGVDYVTKPIKPRELIARVRTHLELRQLITHLEYISTHDKMSTLLNRGHFFKLAQTLWNQPEPQLHAAIFDIDHFKNINDSHGHHMGDQVIIGVSALLREQLDGHAICGRIGGEEFAALWAGASSAQVQQSVQQILDAVRARIWGENKGQEIRCTISAGIATRNPGAATLDAMLIEADTALYQAKNQGRDRCVLASTVATLQGEYHPPHARESDRLQPKAPGAPAGLCGVQST